MKHPHPDHVDLEVRAFLQGRSVPCPRCGHDLRDGQSATCLECGERLELRIGLAQPSFGWLVLAMAPGCFSGITAVFVLIPIVGALMQGASMTRGVPWPIMAADAFGFLSAGSVWLMYRHRRRIMAWRPRVQGAFAGMVWGCHVLALVLTILALWLLR